jgi:hypothetical protein
MMSSAASAAAAEAGVIDAEKMRARLVCCTYSITSRDATANPPRLANDFENVPTITSTWSSSPKCSQTPRPSLPSTPTPCASSTITRAP